MFSWKELYFGTDFKEYTRIRNILEDNQIPAKTQVTNTRSRMSGDLPSVEILQFLTPQVRKTLTMNTRFS